MSRPRFPTRAISVAVFALTAATTVARADELLNSANADRVYNRPWSNPTFTNVSPWQIDRIVDYHYNYGVGDAPGSIALVNLDTGTTYSFTAEAGLLPGDSALDPASAGWVKWYWNASPGVVLDPGTYQIQDSNPSTWSYSVTNIYSAYGVGKDWQPGVGMSWIYGEALTMPVPEPSTPASLLAGLGVGAALLRRRRAAAN